MPKPDRKELGAAYRALLIDERPFPAERGPSQENSVEMSGDERRAALRAGRLHSANLYLIGRPEPFRFLVSADDSDRLWRTFANQRAASDDAFASFDTLDGFAVAVAVSDVQFAQFACDYGATVVVDEPPSSWNLQLFFRGRDHPTQDVLEDFEELAYLFDFLELESLNDVTPLSFLDSGGEPVVAMPADISLAIGVLADVEDGRAKIREEDAKPLTPNPPKTRARRGKA